MSEATEIDIQKLFYHLAGLALLYPYRLADPIGIYMELPFVDKSKEMEIKLWKEWIRVKHEYPWPLNVESVRKWIQDNGGVV